MGCLNPLWTSPSHGSLFPPSLSVSSKKRAIRDSSFREAIVRRFFVHTDLKAVAYPSLLPFNSNASPTNPPLGNLKAPPSVMSISPWAIGPLTRLGQLVWTFVPISTLSSISSPGLSRPKLSQLPTGLKMVEFDHPSPASSNTMLAR